MVKDARSGGSVSEKQEKAIDNALTIASSNAALAEAQLAVAFGFEMCKCEFPPTPMLTVGYKGGGQAGEGPVFECPKCGFNTAGIWSYTRTKPPRQST
jgi:hypothetical protein